MKFLRDPLLHFLLIGAALFVVYGLVSDQSEPEPDRIVVTPGRIENLKATFARTWQRPPTEQEQKALIDDFVREEVFYREALALGLDRDDTIIRRRMRQKMEFLSEDIAAQAEPTDEQLQIFLDAHPDTFMVEPTFNFRQLYLNPKRRGENLTRDVQQLLARLKQGPVDVDVSELGDSLLLERSFDKVTEADIRNTLGPEFFDALEKLKLGAWQGPIKSAYGVHLVLLTEHVEGQVPVLDDIRDAVRRDFAHARRKETEERLYQDLLRRYEVVVQTPSEQSSDSEPKTMASAE